MDLTIFSDETKRTYNIPYIKYHIRCQILELRDFYLYTHGKDPNELYFIEELLNSNEDNNIIMAANMLVNIKEIIDNR